MQIEFPIDGIYGSLQGTNTLLLSGVMLNDIGENGIFPYQGYRRDFFLYLWNDVMGYDMTFLFRCKSLRANHMNPVLQDWIDFGFVIEREDKDDLGQINRDPCKVFVFKQSVL